MSEEPKDIIRPQHGEGYRTTIRRQGNNGPAEINGEAQRPMRESPADPRGDHHRKGGGRGGPRGV